MTSTPVLPSSALSAPDDASELTDIIVRFDYDGLHDPGSRLVVGRVRDPRYVGMGLRKEPDELRLKLHMASVFEVHLRYLLLELARNHWSLVTSPDGPTSSNKDKHPGVCYLLEADNPEPRIGNQRIAGMLTTAGIGDEKLHRMIGATFRFSRQDGIHASAQEGTIIGIEVTEGSVHLSVVAPNVFGIIKVMGFHFSRANKWQMEVDLGEEKRMINGALAFSFPAS